jgi:ubiquinone biosynthesis monooxygenase Coq7
VNTLLDKFIGGFDVALRSLCVPNNRQAIRPNPADGLAEPILSQEETRHVAGLMRVNHSGEVCAQALYQGQALTAKLPFIKDKMKAAALDEVDHLAWCEARLRELGSAPSVLNPVWYSASLTIGLLAGLIGDKWSLGFVAETEQQVTEHLKKHRDYLPMQDDKTKAILYQMQLDETLHADVAEAAGAADLPFIIKKGMQFASKLMTKTSYYG